MKVKIFSDNAELLIIVYKGEEVIYYKGNSELYMCAVHVDEMPLDKVPEWVQKEVNAFLTS